MTYISYGFIGTQDTQTTTSANQSIITDIPNVEGGNYYYCIRKINLTPFQDCHITLIRNGKNLKTIFLKAYSNFTLGYGSFPITDISIRESGTQYTYYGEYGGSY